MKKELKRLLAKKPKGYPTDIFRRSVLFISLCA